MNLGIFFKLVIFIFLPENDIVRGLKEGVIWAWNEIPRREAGYFVQGYGLGFWTVDRRGLLLYDFLRLAVSIGSHQGQDISAGFHGGQAEGIQSGLELFFHQQLTI